MRRKNQDAVENIKLLGSRRPIFSPEKEQELLKHILELKERFYGLTWKDVRKVAFPLAERKKIKHNFNRDTKMIGKTWTTAFRKHHPALTLPTPESYSSTRFQ